MPKVKSSGHDSSRVEDSDTENREFESISERAHHLLHREEGFEVDFKRSLSGLDSEDLVSFANSKRGGAILIGVDETKDGDGRQLSSVVGCAIGDAEKLKVLSKSNQCVPPVKVAIFVENSGDKPFYRIEVPSGAHKPYCTQGGTYKIRGDGRNETLYPPQLLALFLETEGGEFLRRFQQATKSLESAVTDTKERITAELKDLGESVSIMEGDLKESLNTIWNSASNAESNAEEAHGLSEEAVHLLDQVHGMVEDLAVGDPELDSISIKLDAILEKLAIEDPALFRNRKYVKVMARALAERSRKRGVANSRRWIVSTLQQIFSKTDNKIVAEWVKEALAESAAPDELSNLLPRYSGILEMVIENEVQKKQKKPGASQKRTLEMPPKTVKRRS